MVKVDGPGVDIILHCTVSLRPVYVTGDCPPKLRTRHIRETQFPSLLKDSERRQTIMFYREQQCWPILELPRWLCDNLEFVGLSKCAQGRKQVPKPAFCPFQEVIVDSLSTEVPGFPEGQPWATCGRAFLPLPCVSALAKSVLTHFNHGEAAHTFKPLLHFRHSAKGLHPYCFC